MSAFQKLERRKIGQWALAYLAGAWVTLQLAAILAGQFGWPAEVQQALTVVLAVGLPITLVVAWYHGEQGRQRVSGPELLMVAALLVVGGSAVAWVREAPATDVPGPGAGADPAASPDRAERAGAPPFGGRDAGPVSPRSVAVLPLENHSPPGEHGWFAAAMTEEIPSALSGVPDLRVLSRTTAAKYSVSGASIEEFARRVGVAHVLEGSVRRVGDEVRITVQLIDASTAEHLWSGTYDRRLTDVLDAQVEIARHVADRLAATFTSGSASGSWPAPPTTRWPTTSSSGPRSSRRRSSRGSGSSARSISCGGRLSGTRTSARRGASSAAGTTSSGCSPPTTRGPTPSGSPSAGPASSRTPPSLELKYRAWKVWGLGDDREDVREAVGLLREAVEANPGSVELMVNLSDAFLTVGDLAESVRWWRRAVEIDPLDARLRADLAWRYMTVGLDARAERAIRRAAGSDPESVRPWEALSELRMLQGRYRDALVRRGLGPCPEMAGSAP